MIRDVTLTFDNGPTEAVTPHVLDVLARFGIKSTFFVLGQNLQSSQTLALVERAVREGHWIGNHTFTHTIPLGLSPDEATAKHEIGDTQDLIAAHAHKNRLFRPFGGGGFLNRELLSSAALDFLVSGGYTCVLWNAVPHDWDDPDGWVETALAQCRTLPKALVVLHDYDTGALKHLETFLQRALDEGAQFRQDFPPECVPLLRGTAVLPIDDFVATH